MKKYWMSYDLGVGGDYDRLYQWLDDHKAVPCGNSVAYFGYQYQEGENPDEKLKEELLKSIDLKPGNILYIIRKKEGEDKYIGSFIHGKRQAAPWTGFGSTPSQDDDE